MTDNDPQEAQQKSYDAVVVGAGPNGLAAGIVLAQHGLAVLIVEGDAEIGGGMRSRELTLPGFVHDVCSAIHPMAALSPLFQTLPLADHGLRWIEPPACLAHPLDVGPPGIVRRSLEETAGGMGEDGEAWLRLFGPQVEAGPKLVPELLGPAHWPSDVGMAWRFGRLAIQSACRLIDGHFKQPQARAALGGMAAHSFLPLEDRASSAIGLMLTIAAHLVGWPLPEGGSRRLAEALAAHFRSLGGEIVTGRPVASLDALPSARAVLLDVTPRQLLRIAGTRLSPRYRRRLGRYRYGPGAYKVDWALDGPIPWRATECLQAGTVHVGGTFEEVAAAERVAFRGQIPQRPFVLVAQQSLFDASRAPAGRHTAWGYCHVPHGCEFDMTERIESQIERFAPGFRQRILARHVMPPARLEQYNPNYVGGDISGGVNDLWQLLARPVASRVPYATSDPAVFICSSSTPPGGGVHGMCGYHAALAVLRRQFGRTPMLLASLPHGPQSVGLG
ncbi:MAG TPA: NAD(P)/FAD-dependent oxidoreductase [Pirellulales bacterium]|nr:NAD(P)/FAD-dependent oxidoreductase [Pirellulales bacterium]